MHVYNKRTRGLFKFMEACCKNYCCHLTGAEYKWRTEDGNLLLRTIKVHVERKEYNRMPTKCCVITKKRGRWWLKGL